MWIKVWWEKKLKAFCKGIDWALSVHLGIKEKHLVFLTSSGTEEDQEIQEMEKFSMPC